MRHFELVFLVVTSCTSGETNGSTRPPSGSKEDAATAVVDSSTPITDAATATAGDANVKPAYVALFYL